MLTPKKHIFFNREGSINHLKQLVDFVALFVLVVSFYCSFDYQEDGLVGGLSSVVIFDASNTN